MIIMEKVPFINLKTCFRRLENRIEGDFFVGGYGGLGLRFPIRKGAILLYADYTKAQGGSFPTKYDCFSTHLGYQF